MNKITNRQVICDVLLAAAETDNDVTVLCSDSRGSASLAPFADKHPNQFVETGIAEQNLVSVAAGLASCGKKAYAASPACFLSTRSYEQVKVDVAYSNTNVKLIGISGGISYGSLGMTHHSCQDIAALSAIPDMRVYMPCDRFQTKKLIEALLNDDKPAYIRVSRNPSIDVYDEDYEFTINHASIVKNGSEVIIVACGETVAQAKFAAEILEAKGMSVGVLDMYCLKPFDAETLLKITDKAKLVVTVEEHSPFGGLGAVVAQAISANFPKKVINIALPDSHLIAGKDSELFAYYGLDGQGIVKTVLGYLK